jgi:hypothetical protein
MAAVAATYAADDRAAQTHCTATPSPCPRAPELGADNALVEKLLTSC